MFTGPRLLTPVSRISDSVHRIKQIFALRINVYAEFLTFTAQSIFQIGDGRLRARRIGDDHHRKFSLHHGLINIDDTALGFRENLGDARDNARMIDAENRNDDSI